MNAVLLSSATFVSTFVGGLCALRFSDRLHWVLALTAGALLGVVCFDLLPDIFALSHSQGDGGRAAMVALVLGFLFFHGLSKWVQFHGGKPADLAGHLHPQVGVTSALALIGHSFMDGVGIGLGFQVSPAVGLTVAMAVVAHDFCDGLNTVSLMLVHGNSKRRALWMLVMDALAPVLGAVSTLAFRVPPGALLLYLGFLAGFLLYIGVSDILPAAHLRGGRRAGLPLVGLTAVGAAVVYLVTPLA